MKKGQWKPTKPTICWDCKNAVGGCSWSKHFIPVEGWKAIPTKIRYGHKRPPTESYIVEECPKFERG